MAFLGLEILNKGIDEIRDKGTFQSLELGFSTFMESKEQYLRLAKGYPILIGGEPHVGKSEFTNEIIMQLIEIHNFKIALFLTENGRPQDVFALFMSLYIGKKFSKIDPFTGKETKFTMTNDEVQEAKKFIMGKLFVFKIDELDDKYTTIDNIYKELITTEQMYGFKFDSLVIDPLYDVDDFQAKETELKKLFTRINYECLNNKRIDIIVTHVSETQKVYDKKH